MLGVGPEVERQRREARQLPDPRAQGRHVRELRAAPKAEKWYQNPVSIYRFPKKKQRRRFRSRFNWNTDHARGNAGHGT